MLDEDEEYLPDPGFKPSSLASPALAGSFFTTVPAGKPTGMTRSLITFIQTLSKQVNHFMTISSSFQNHHSTKLLLTGFWLD